MTLIQGSEYFHKKNIIKAFSGFSSNLRFDHNKLWINSLNLIIDYIVSLIKFLIAKYMKKDLQKYFKIVLKALASFSDKLCERHLKARSPNIYCI